MRAHRIEGKPVSKQLSCVINHGHDKIILLPTAHYTTRRPDLSGLNAVQSSRHWEVVNGQSKPNKESSAPYIYMYQKYKNRILARENGGRCGGWGVGQKNAQEHTLNQTTTNEPKLNHLPKLASRRAYETTSQFGCNIEYSQVRPIAQKMISRANLDRKQENDSRTGNPAWRIRHVSSTLVYRSCRLTVTSSNVLGVNWELDLRHLEAEKTSNSQTKN